MRLTFWNTKPMRSRRTSAASAALEASDLGVAQLHRARGRCRQRAREREQRRLAGAARAFQDEQLAVGDLEVDVVDRDDGLVAGRELLADLRQRQRGRSSRRS